jgi:hypothetical protein
MRLENRGNQPWSDAPMLAGRAALGVIDRRRRRTGC